MPNSLHAAVYGAEDRPSEVCQALPDFTQLLAGTQPWNYSEGEAAAVNGVSMAAFRALLFFLF